MTDPAVLEGVTQRIVDSYTGSGLLFTALDVSNQVKQTLPDVRHRFVSPIVRALFDKGAMGSKYKRSLIDVITEGRKPAQAYLYHLVGADIAEGYGSDMRNQLAIPPVSASLEDEALDETVDEYPLLLGADGRARLPMALLDWAKIDTDDVLAEMLGDDLVLSRSGGPVAPNAVVLNSIHPTLLHIPIECLGAFDLDKPLRARVIGTQVYVTGELSKG